MPRPRKYRRVCQLPTAQEFRPVGQTPQQPTVILSVDEFEAVRLIDKEGFSQEECAAYMQVARTTVQMIYNTARRKLADVLVDGLPLRIEGGSYQLCNGRDAACGQQLCYKQELSRLYDIAKGENCMRIAVTYEYETGEIFQHFGHTETFKVYDVENDRIVNAQVVGTNGSGHGALAEVLHALNVDVLICGGIGGGAQMALAGAGIKLYGGVSGSADAAAEALVAGQLDYDPNARCDHHDHHGSDHACGSHSCGEHSCGHH